MDRIHPVFTFAAIYEGPLSFVDKLSSCVDLYVQFILAEVDPAAGDGSGEFSAGWRPMTPHVSA